MSWLGCNVYVSEGRNLQLIKQLEAVAKSTSSRVTLVNTFVDRPYNRASFTLLSPHGAELADAAVQVARGALQALDLRLHEASHPRLGTVDHVSCHPLERGAALAGAAACAQDIGAALAEKHGVPVFLYGAAHPEGRRLDDIRRAAGYFRGAAQGSWSGALPAATAAAATAAGGGLTGTTSTTANGVHAPPTPTHPLRPDLGPAGFPPRTGVACVGAVPWLVNYNVLLDCRDLGRARRIARAVSERGGGLREVQAMALEHDDGIEIACNILDDSVSPPEAVLRRVAELAAVEAGAGGGGGGGSDSYRVLADYRISKPPEQLVAEARRLLGM